MPKTKLGKTKKIKIDPCFFCQKKEVPDYKNIDDLKFFLTPRNKIADRKNTGVCAKHQRRLQTAIKRARFLALLPFTPQI